VLANGSVSSNQSGEGDIRKVIIEADLVDCMVALPGQLFYSTQILNFLSHDNPGRLEVTVDQARDFVRGLQSLLKRCEDHNLIRGR